MLDLSLSSRYLGLEFELGFKEYFFELEII
jgi:hypothetical protein